jgi:hypothetical protein
MLRWPRLGPSQGEMRAWVFPLCRVLMMKKILGALVISLTLAAAASGGDWCCKGCDQNCYSFDPCYPRLFGGCNSGCGNGGGCNSGFCNSGSWRWSSAGVLPCHFFHWCRFECDRMSAPWYTYWPASASEFAEGPVPKAFPYWPTARTANWGPQPQPASGQNFGGPFAQAPQQFGSFQPPSYWYGR